ASCCGRSRRLIQSASARICGFSLRFVLCGAKPRTDALQIGPNTLLQNLGLEGYVAEILDRSTVNSLQYRKHQEWINRQSVIERKSEVLRGTGVRCMLELLPDCEPVRRCRSDTGQDGFGPRRRIVVLQKDRLSAVGLYFYVEPRRRWLRSRHAWRVHQ